MRDAHVDPEHHNSRNDDADKLHRRGPRALRRRHGPTRRARLFQTHSPALSQRFLDAVPRQEPRRPADHPVAVTWYEYNGGSRPARWGLKPGTYANSDVIEICGLCLQKA